MCNTTYKTLFNNRTQYLPQNRGEGRPWVHNIGILLEGGGHTQQGQGPWGTHTGHAQCRRHTTAQQSAYKDRLTTAGT